jgi:hypothetical protein
MASSRPFEPVIHCAPEEPQAVYNLANRVLTQGIYINTTLFPTAGVPVTQAVFSAAVAKLSNLISQAKGNTNVVNQRDAQSVLVHGYLTQLCNYAKPICNHDKANIALSGFDASDEPMPTVVPPAPVISKVTEGKVAGSYKVYLKRAERKKLGVVKKSHSKGNTRYTVQITSSIANTPISWTTVLEGAASTRLVFTGLTGKVWIHVYGINAAGKGQPSAPFPFTPQL